MARLRVEIDIPWEDYDVPGLVRDIEDILKFGMDEHITVTLLPYDVGEGDIGVEPGA